MKTTKTLIATLLISLSAVYASFLGGCGGTQGDAVQTITEHECAAFARCGDLNGDVGACVDARLNASCAEGACSEPPSLTDAQIATCTSTLDTMVCVDVGRYGLLNSQQAVLEFCAGM